MMIKEVHDYQAVQRRCRVVLWLVNHGRDGDWIFQIFMTKRPSCFPQATSLFDSVISWNEEIEGALFQNNHIKVPGLEGSQFDNHVGKSSIFLEKKIVWPF